MVGALSRFLWISRPNLPVEAAFVDMPPLPGPPPPPAPPAGRPPWTRAGWTRWTATTAWCAPTTPGPSPGTAACATCRSVLAGGAGAAVLRSPCPRLEAARGARAMGHLVLGIAITMCWLPCALGSCGPQALENRNEWPKRPIVPSYPVAEKGGFIWLFYGSPSLPEEQRPPIPFTPELGAWALLFFLLSLGGAGRWGEGFLRSWGKRDAAGAARAGCALTEHACTAWPAPALRSQPPTLPACCSLASRAAATHTPPPACRGP